MRLFKTSIVVGAAAIALLVGACSGGDSAPSANTATTGTTATAATGGGGGGSTIALKLEDIKYDTTKLSATAGQPLTIDLTNAGALEHDFTIDKMDGTATLDGKDASTGSQAVHASLKSKAAGELVITPSEAGEYEFYCTVAGHREAGMHGTLTVK